MQRESIERIFQALNAASVRYLVAGGLAVVAHGYVRFTADLDLILDLEDANVRRAVTALSSLGYRPRAPVPFDDFADPNARRQWVAEKGLTVFSLQSPQHPTTELDLFVECPVDFASAHASALNITVAAEVRAAVLGYAELTALKRRAGRPQDMIDVQQLERIREQTKP